MKKFVFSLSKLQDYKEQVLRKEKNDLATLRRQQQAVIDEQEQLRLKYHRAKTDFSAAALQGMTQQELMASKRYINLLSDDIRATEERIAELEAGIEQQLGVVVEATKEVSSLDKLKERQLEDYKKLEQKQQETFIEEFVANSSFYAK